MFSLDVTNGLLPNSINVYVSSVDVEKDIHTSQKVGFPLPWKLDDVSHPLKPWMMCRIHWSHGWCVASTETMEEWQCLTNTCIKLIKYFDQIKLSVSFFFKSTAKMFFAPACIYLLREVSKRSRTSESAVQMVMFSKSLAVSRYCRINLGSASSVVM